jgi:hypothetical protein
MRPPAPGSQDDAKAIVKGTRYPAGWRTPYTPKGLTLPPKDLGAVPEWFQERVGMTQAGSYIAGVPPTNGTPDEYRAAAMVVLPSITAVISKTLAKKIPITVLTEGTPYNPDSASKPADGSEIVAATVAGSTRVLGLAAASYDTWDDAPVNVYDPKSPVWERLTHAAKDLNTARAAIAARMLAVGVSTDELREVGILNAQSSLKFEELTGRKPPTEVTPSIMQALRTMVYPGEFEAEPTVISALSDLYDSLRASNFLRKLHAAEQNGGVVVAAVPPWMGYALKPVILRLNARERARRKEAAFDLEMAWGRKLIAKTFDESVKGKKFKNPETGNRVQFKSLSSDEQAKIRSQWESRSKGDSEHSEGATAAARETAKRIVDDIDRPKGWRSSGDEPDLTKETRKAWEAEHSAKTPGGSVLLGTTHMDSEDPTTGAMNHADPTAKASFKEHVINSAVDAAKAAAKASKKVVVLSEGTMYGEDTLDDPNDWNEQHAVAKAVHEATGGKAVQDTWDDDTVSLTNPESDVWKRMTSAAGDDPVKAKGALAVFMAGQGQSWDSMVEDGWVDDDVAEAVKKATGTDPRGKLSKKTQQRFYDMAFPGDSGKSHTEVSAIGEVYNAARQENLLRKIREVEADGGVVIAAPGASHAYNLKGVIEGRGKTSADLDLEMAWGWNARVALKINEILTGLSPKVTSGAKSVTPKLKRADPNNAMWTYTVPGSKGETYTVKVKGIPKGGLRNVVKMDVRVSCTCPFFRYQGPEHWAKVGDYLYGKPAGTAAKPDQKDPNGGNRICKHVAAVFRRADNLVYTPPKARTAATTPVPDQFPSNEAGLKTLSEYIDHLNPDQITHSSDAYDYTSFKMNEDRHRHYVGKVDTRRGPLSVYRSTLGLIFVDEDKRPVAVIGPDGVLYYEARTFDIPNDMQTGPHRDPIPLGIERRKQVKYIADYVALVDNVARRNLEKYPVVLRRFMYAGEAMVIRAEEQPVPDEGTNLAVLDSAGRVVAVAQNEWGATLISVAREARSRGLGKVISKVWHELNPSFDSGGMTQRGSNLMSSVWADRVREFMARGWYSQLIRDGRLTREQVSKIIADLPGSRSFTPAAAPVVKARPMLMSDGETFVTVYDQAILEDPSLLEDPDDKYIYGHAFLRDDSRVGTYVFSIDYDRPYAQLTTKAILQLARDNGHRLYDGEGYHDILEGIESTPAVEREGDYLVVTQDLIPLRSAAALERRMRKAADRYGELEAAIQERADAKWR